MLTLMVSVFAVSLSTTVESVGPMSEVALMNLFLKHDTDNSGTIDAPELGKVMRALGQNLTTAELHNMMKVGDRVL